MNKAIVTIGSVVLMVAATSSPSIAQDWVSGKQLTETWCLECHTPSGAAQATDAAPPFKTIVNQPEYTEDRLRVWLTDPHPPMPNFNLSKREIDDIIAYLKRLRK